MQNNKNKRQGLTLVEMIVAIAFFGVISVVYLLIFSSSLLITVRSGVKEKAIVEVTSSMDLFNIDNEAILPEITIDDTKPVGYIKIYYYGSNTEYEYSGTEIDAFLKIENNIVGDQFSEMKGFSR